jgi:hypothetical protein
MEMKQVEDIQALSDEELLKCRFCDLPLKIEDSALASIVEKFYSELAAKGISFRPKLYLGDEWFSAEGIPAIAIPFYLAHPRLRALEQSIMLDVEGGTEEECLRLLRHEAGHAFDHAFKFSRRKKWQQIFGSPDSDYTPETYRPRPYSKSFVRHLDNWYAQAHPDEDFAETFAVWLTPDIDWRKRYARWPVALKKLEYMDSLAKEISKKTVKMSSTTTPYNVRRMTKTLQAFYQQKKKQNAEEYPDFFDRDLQYIFNGDVKLSKREYGATGFMKRNHKHLIQTLNKWTKEKKFTINAFLKRLEQRTQALDLRLGRSEGETALELASYLATMITYHLFTGRFKRSI